MKYSGIKEQEMRAKKRETPSAFTVTWVGQQKSWDIKERRLRTADTSEAREKESQKWKRRDFYFFPPYYKLLPLHTEYTSFCRPHCRKSIRGKWSKAIVMNTKNPKDK